MDESIGAATALPGKVWAIGIVRDTPTYDTPITTEEGLGLAPLSVVDADGERAVPVFTSQEKAERGINQFMSEEERANHTVAAARVVLEDLLTTFALAPPPAPAVDYIGVDMSEGGDYLLVRL